MKGETAVSYRWKEDGAFMQTLQIDYNLAEECARSYHISTNLGCAVADNCGNILFEHGYGCGCCNICCAAGYTTEQAREICARVHHYGMTEAERFGGKYIYYCPLGLSFFTSLIIGDAGTSAGIIAGPLLMVEPQDYVQGELETNPQISDTAIENILRHLDHIPYIEPKKVQEMSVLLFMAVGFMNNMSAESDFLTQERNNLLQGQISSYISALKEQAAYRSYPFEKEHALLQSISRHDPHDTADKLHACLAALFVSGSDDMDWIRTKTQELSVMISRSAIEHGATEDETLAFLDLCRKNIPLQKDFLSLCSWYYDAFMHYISHLWAYPDAKHADVIQHCIQYIHEKYAEHPSLEEAASVVSLSPDYLSRIFRQETGITYSQYLTNACIDKAKDLIRHSTLRLTDISQMVGYEDQSYFTKVFKRTTGTSPNEYRKLRQKKG